MALNLQIIYNHFEKSAFIKNSLTKGCLHYDKNDKTFSCDMSDTSCMGIKNIPPIFDVMVKESGNTKTFVISQTKRDEECEIQYWMFKADDNSGIKFIIFND